MKILMLLSSASVTGPAEVCLSDAIALRDVGHQIVFGCDTNRPGNFVQAIEEAGFERASELTLCKQASAGAVLRDVARLRRRLAEADVVHCRFSHEQTLAMLAMKTLIRRPLLVRSAEIAEALRPGWGRGVAFRAADAILVPCRAYAERLQQIHRVPAERIRALPGRVDTQRFSPGDGCAMRSELGVDSEQVLFGIVSRIKAERHHELLVKAFARVAAEHPEARLAIVGRGENEPQVRALVERLGLQQKVFFAGYRTGEKLVDAYRALDVKVWLAEGNDGTCRAVLEAMACGKPVIVGDGGALPEMVRDGIDGRVVALQEEPLAKAIADLCDPESRSRAAKSALERTAGFALPVRARAIVEVYRELGAGRGAVAPQAD
jgi:glycosyltransferase involved in cell wall biosynthesis